MTKRSKAEDDYWELFKSGMFFEFYPNLTGNYEKDKTFWLREHRMLERYKPKNLKKKKRRKE